MYMAALTKFAQDRLHISTLCQLRSFSSIVCPMHPHEPKIIIHPLFLCFMSTYLVMCAHASTHNPDAYIMKRIQTVLVSHCMPAEHHSAIGLLSGAF